MSEALKDFCLELIKLADKAWKPVQVFRDDEQVSIDDVRYEVWSEVADLAKERLNAEDHETDSQEVGLSSFGIQEAERLIENFKKSLIEAAEPAISAMYCNIAHWIESDSWDNFKEQVLQRICNYNNKDSDSYTFSRIRRAIFEEFKDEILKDLNQDLVEENKKLKEENKKLKEENKALTEDYYIKD